MPPEQTTGEVLQTAPEAGPIVEAPAAAAEPVTAPEAPPAIPEVQSTNQSAPQAETAPAAEATPGTQPSMPTAQTPPDEPIEPEPEPVQPPSAAAPVPTGILHTARDLLAKARVSIQDRKRKKRDKIMEALTKKNRITNDEVEKLLHVSDATATRYLTALEKEGRIQQVGKTGTGVAYSKI